MIINFIVSEHHLKEVKKKKKKKKKKIKIKKKKKKKKRHDNSFQDLEKRIALILYAHKLMIERLFIPTRQSE